MNKKSLIALLASTVVLSASAVAAPVLYNFTTGPLAGTSGTGVGLLPSGLTASGSFRYDTSAPVLQPGPAGVGTWYAGAITDFTVNIGSFSAQDSFGYARVVDSALDTFLADGTPHSTDRDFLQFFLGPTGGAWSATPIGATSVARIRFNWLQAPQGPDFIVGESLLPTLPSFAGNFFLDIGPLTGADPLSPASGSVGFVNFRAVQVPEPATLGLCALALSLMGLSLRVRSTHSRNR